MARHRKATTSHKKPAKPKKPKHLAVHRQAHHVARKGSAARSTGIKRRIINT